MKLRRIEKSDLSLLRQWRNDPRIYSWCRQNNLISEIDQEKWFIKQNDDPTIRMFCFLNEHEPEISNGSEWGHSCKHTPECIIGVCGLTDIDLVNRRAEFSLYVAPEFQGKGYARGVLKLLFEHGFDDLNLNLIWGETFAFNPAQYLFEKIGMKRDGVRRDFYFKGGEYIDAILYSIKREEWVL